jgi:hypothetical protein
VQCLRKVVKGHGLVFLLPQTAHGLGREFAVLGECSRPVGSRHPPWWAVPKYPPARSQRAFRTRLGTALKTLRCLCKRHRWRGVAGNSSCTAASSPSWPSVTMRSSLCRCARTPRPGAHSPTPLCPPPRKLEPPTPYLARALFTHLGTRTWRPTPLVWTSEIVYNRRTRTFA